MYDVDIDAVRAEAEKLVHESPYWDKKRFELLVTDSKETTLELHVTVSAHNSGNYGSCRPAFENN